MNRWHEWTACQMYGHRFAEPDGTPTDQCVDCGEPAESSDTGELQE